MKINKFAKSLGLLGYITFGLIAMIGGAECYQFITCGFLAGIFFILIGIGED